MKLAVVGLGRIGVYHAQHVAELAARSGSCELAAVVEPRPEAVGIARSLSAIQGSEVRVFETLEELIASGCSDAAVIASPTALHKAHASTLVRAGHRVLVEKPLTDSLANDRLFCGELDANHPHALMLAFQRRFDAPLRHAKALLGAGQIGRPFKFVSVLEDSRLMPEGYESPGLLQDMSVHNIDEILWLSGKTPKTVEAFGSRLYSHRVAPVEEDFDDALLQLTFDGEVAAQIHVGRNHVAGYRVETWIFGEEGVIHVGGFHQNSHEVVVEAYGREKPIDVRSFPLRDYGSGVPEFLERFGDAYAAELAVFVRHCVAETPFPVDQSDGLRATEVIGAGVKSLRRSDGGR